LKWPGQKFVLKLNQEKLKVLFIVNGYPSDENPSKDIFNKRSVILLCPKVDLTLVQFRIFIPGRKIYFKENKDGFTKIILSVPYIPFFEKHIYYFNLKIFGFVLKYFCKSELQKADIFHSGDGNIGLIGASIKDDFRFKLLAQFIGGDINEDYSHQYKKIWIKRLVDKFDAVGFNSRFLLEKFHSYFPKNSSLAKVIYRGVDLEKFNYSFNEPKSYTFYFLGGFPAYKGFKFGRNTKGGFSILNAWQRLDEKDLVVRSKLVIAGPDTNISELAFWKGKLRYPENVKILPLISPDKIPEFHARGEVALIPSMTEGLPNVAMEASASGNYIIASNVGGLPEIVNNGKGGVLIPPGDEKALEKSMFDYISNPDLYSDIGKTGRNYVIDHFDQQKFGEMYFQLYQKTMNIAS